MQVRWWATVLGGLLLVSSHAHAVALAPSGGVRGVVTSAETGLPLVSAEVRLEAEHLEQGGSTVTVRADGSFVFGTLADGTYALEARSEGSLPVHVERVRIVAGRFVSRHLALEATPAPVSAARQGR